LITRLLDAIENASRWPTLRPMPWRWQIVTFAVVLGLLGAAERASGDTLRVTQIHNLTTSGAIAATVRSNGPPNTALAINLYHGRCPARPQVTDVEPGIGADGQSHLLLANPPRTGEHGAFELCVWTIHEDGTIGAHYNHTTTLAAPTAESWNPAAGTTHSWWWPLVGWPTLLAIGAVIFIVWILIPAALIRGLVRSAKRHFGRSDERETQAEGDGATLDQVRQRAAEAAAVGAAAAESPTLRYGTVPLAPRRGGAPGPAPYEPPAGWSARGSISSTGGHPFTPPQSIGSPEPPNEPPLPGSADTSEDEHPPTTEGSD
jgi:hypothetical protein